MKNKEKDSEYYEEEINKLLENTNYNCVLYDVKDTNRTIIKRLRKKLSMTAEKSKKEETITKKEIDEDDFYNDPLEIVEDKNYFYG